MQGLPPRLPGSMVILLLTADMRCPLLSMPSAASMPADGIIRGVRKQVLMQVLQGTADSNIRFDDLRSLLAALGFGERVKGSHHIFARPGVAEILNVQPRDSFAKAYQVKQVRSVIVRYKLAEGAQ
jgi:hypothetical protein